MTTKDLNNAQLMALLSLRCNAISLEGEKKTSCNFLLTDKHQSQGAGDPSEVFLFNLMKSLFIINGKM